MYIEDDLTDIKSKNSEKIQKKADELGVHISDGQLSGLLADYGDRIASYQEIEDDLDLISMEEEAYEIPDDREE